MVSGEGILEAWSLIIEVSTSLVNFGADPLGLFLHMLKFWHRLFCWKRGWFLHVFTVFRCSVFIRLFDDLKWIEYHLVLPLKVSTSLGQII